MIIVAGHIVAKQGKRDERVALSREAMIAARRVPGCHDFVVTADPLEPDHVHVFESWDDEASMKAFRGSGPGSGLRRLIIGIDVRTYAVRSA